MTEHDGARPLETAPDSAHPVTDGFAPSPLGTRPLEVHPDRPGADTAPDIIALPAPEHPGPRPPDDAGTASREELEMALRRAQLVADDCASLLDPAQRAMEDGAWVSRLADEFSTGLTTHARLAGTVADGCVETIQTALDTRRDDPLEVHA
jgi:succinate dehydrogenase/fumarate reductase flavoprotein subunit